MAAQKKGGARKSSSRKGRGKVQKVMHEYKHGELKSGGRKKVKNPKQAIAIALSEERRAGADVPPRKGAKKATRKSTAKSGSKRAGTKKSASRKSSGGRKTASRKASSRKSASKRR